MLVSFVEGLQDVSSVPCNKNMTAHKTPALPSRIRMTLKVYNISLLKLHKNVSKGKSKGCEPVRIEKEKR